MSKMNWSEEDAIKNLAVWATLNLPIEYFD